MARSTTSTTEASSSPRVGQPYQFREFEALIAPLVELSVDAMARVLENARAEPAALSGILLVGMTYQRLLPPAPASPGP